MSAAVAEPASFRDPSGRVYRRDDRIFRTIMEPAAADFEFVRSTGLIERLSAEGRVVPAEPVGMDALGAAAEGARYVVEHPRLPFISYPYEWPFPALKAAALLHIGIHLEALERGVTLSDASAYNVQFRGPRPVFIDTLSFRRYTDGDFWTGHRQFCEQFLNPLLLRAFLGIPHNTWYRGSLEGIGAEEINRLLPLSRKVSWNALTHVVLQASLQRTAANGKDDAAAGAIKERRLPLAAFRRMLERLGRWIEALEPLDTGRTVWAEYADNNSYAAPEAAAKEDMVRQFAAAVRPGMLWDLGCNTGAFSKAALEAGAKHAIGFDFDQGALEAAFARAEAEDLDLLPLYLDAANPSPSQGWAQNERQGLMERAPADGLLALAFVHHLAIARNMPLELLVDWLVALAPQGLVEFVPKTDPMVQRMLRLREDIFAEYNEENFLACLTARARIVENRVVSDHGRRLLWFARH